MKDGICGFSWFCMVLSCSMWVFVTLVERSISKESLWWFDITCFKQGGSLLWLTHLLVIVFGFGFFEALLQRVYCLVFLLVLRYYGLFIMDLNFSMWFPGSVAPMWSRFGFGILLSQNISIWFCFKARELNRKSVGLFCGFCGWLLMVYWILSYIVVAFGSCVYFA